MGVGVGDGGKSKRVGKGGGGGGNLGIWRRNNGAEMVIMTRHANAGSIMHRGQGC